MVVLALDTTTKTASCAIARDGVVLREEAGDTSGHHAVRLPADLMALLERVELTLAEIDAFAVATGPGSFTGLRIGIATMQGLAFATGKPLFGVSAFDALATLAHAEAAREEQATESAACVATWVGAWRGEVFAALYEGVREMVAPVVAQPEPLLAELLDRPVVFIGDGADAFRALIADTLGTNARFTEPINPLLAGTIAMLATADAGARAKQGTPSPTAHAIAPLYVRRTDVELARATIQRGER
jgi:tRNA threonylcarbamoyladenosine biosynthesis protein TsaB